MKSAAAERRESCVYFFGRSSSLSGSLRTKSVLNFPLVYLNGAWPRAECAAVDSALTFIAKASTYFLERLRIETSVPGEWNPRTPPRSNDG